MPNSLLVKIIVPDQILLECHAIMITMPGEEGEFGVMAMHEQLIANLVEGTVKILTDKGEMRYLINGGVAQVTGTEVNLVTASANEL
jgi:F-type H+-transporting ATPase subunit epsilon